MNQLPYLLPLLIPPLIIYFCWKSKIKLIRFAAYPVAFLSFWFLMSMASRMDIYLSMVFAESEAERNELAMHDSGYLFAAYIGGCFFGFFYIAIIGIIHGCVHEHRKSIQLCSSVQQAELTEETTDR